MAELETKPTKVRADGRRRDCITLLAKLGKHKTGKVCLSVKRLSDVDLEVLEELVTASVKHMKSVR